MKVEKSPPPSSEAEAISVTVKKEVVDEVVVEVKKEMIDDDDDEGGVGGSKNFGLQVGDGSSLDQSDEEFDSLTVAKYVPKKQTSSTGTWNFILLFYLDLKFDFFKFFIFLLLSTFLFFIFDC